VPSELTIREAHEIAGEVRHQLLHHLKFLSLVVIHVDPAERSGERFHAIEEHSHDDLPVHSHLSGPNIEVERLTKFPVLGTKHRLRTFNVHRWRRRRPPQPRRKP
jgi:hypothetical protein